VPAWNCGCARTGQLTGTRGTGAGCATRPTQLIAYRAWVANGAASREGASLGLLAPDESCDL
jgi:hypothetical protein